MEIKTEKLPTEGVVQAGFYVIEDSTFTLTGDLYLCSGVHIVRQGDLLITGSGAIYSNPKSQLNVTGNLSISVSCLKWS